MVVNVGFIGHIGLLLQCPLHRLDAPLVLFEREVGNALLVEDLRVFVVDGQGPIQVIDGQLVLHHVKVALGAIFQKFDIRSLRVDSFIEMLDRLVEVFQGVVAATESIVDSWILFYQLTFLEVLDGLANQARLQF